MNQPYSIKNNISLNLNLKHHVIINTLHKSLNFSRIIDFCVTNMDFDHIFHIPGLYSCLFDASENDLDDNAAYYLSNDNVPAITLNNDSLSISQHYKVDDSNTCEQYKFYLTILISKELIELSISCEENYYEIKNSETVLSSLNNTFSEIARMYST
jgi:hypothetical protein